MNLLEINNIAVAEWRSAMLEAFQKGRKKGYVVTHVGVSGTEGKSFLFKPLHGVFGMVSARLPYSPFCGGSTGSLLR